MDCIIPISNCLLSVGTGWTKAFYNTKAHTFTFVDQAGNIGTSTVTPNAAPIVVEVRPRGLFCVEWAGQRLDES